MKNKMELMQAAQTAAAATVAINDALALTKTKITAFEALGINDQHFVEFANFFDQARGQFQAMQQQPVKPAGNIQAAAAPAALPTAG